MDGYDVVKKSPDHFSSPVAAVLYKASHVTNILQLVQKKLAVCQEQKYSSSIYSKSQICIFHDFMHFLYGLSQMPIRTVFPRLYTVLYCTSFWVISTTT